ncbi:MAG TPA: glycerol kinase GlpK [Acidobacteriaceae bacterium]|jgi:glycerol kinase|nr:glycerol kinase GlpK [Acidobacteriaceae bacterium]
MRLILALDQGTTSSRAILFGHDAGVVGVAQQEFRQIYPNVGWVEHDPYDILTSQLTSAVEVLGRAGVRPRDLAALGITNQRETTLIWDRQTGKPIYNAIVWQDRRGAALCRRLLDDGTEEMIRSRTGLLIDSYFSATKIAWILNNVSGARDRAERGQLAFGTVDSWLVWNLTSGSRHITDRTNASRTMLYNIVEDRWDPELLRLLNIPESLMPEVVASSEQVDQVTTSLGLGEVPIAGIAGDQQAALFGQLCVNPGDAKNTYGTGCFLLEHLGNTFTLSRKKLITTLAASPAKKPEYVLEGSIFVGGAVVQWLRDNMRFFTASPDVESVAASVDSTNGVVFVPAFTGLGAPYWDPYASGLIIGIQRSTQIGHIARAAIESIAFQVADVLHAMNQDTQQPLRELRVDGGAAANDLLMQFQADLLGLPVRRPAVLETTALGAAFLAGLAVGFWSSTEEIAKLRGPDTVFEPRGDRAEMLRRRQKWQDAVHRSRDWNRPPETTAP